MLNFQQQNSSTKAYFAYFDYAIVLLAIVANCVVLTAIVRCQLGLPGYRRFLLSLSAGDLYICLVNLLTLGYQIVSSTNNGPPISSPFNGFGAFSTSTSPFYSNEQIITPSSSSSEDDPTRHPVFKCSANVLRTLKLAGFFTNLLNLVGMSIDHFIGVVYPMKYRYLMSKNVARLAVFAIWVISFVLAFLDIPINIILYYGTVNGGQQPNGHTSSLTTAQMLSMMNSLSTAGAGQHHQLFSATTTTNKNRAAQMTAEVQFQNTVITTTTSIYSHNNSNKISIKRSVDELRAVLDELEPHSANLIEEIFNTTSDDDDYIFKADKATSHHIDSDAKLQLNKMLNILRDDDERDKDVCTFFSGGKMWFEISIIVLALFCFAFTTICYGIIFKNVSKSRFLFNSDGSSSHRTRKLIFTTVMFLGAFMICWLPFMSFEFVLLLIIQNGNNVHDEIIETETLFQKFFLVDKFFNSLLMTYPLIDPIIYAARIPAVQQSIWLQLSRLLPCCQLFTGRFLSEHNQRLLSARTSVKMTPNNEPFLLSSQMMMTTAPTSSPSVVSTTLTTFSSATAETRDRVNSNTSTSCINQEMMSDNNNNNSPNNQHLFTKRQTSSSHPCYYSASLRSPVNLAKPGLFLKYNQQHHQLLARRKTTICSF